MSHEEYEETYNELKSKERFQVSQIDAMEKEFGRFRIKYQGLTARKEEVRSSIKTCLIIIGGIFVLVELLNYLTYAINGVLSALIMMAMSMVLNLSYIVTGIYLITVAFRAVKYIRNYVMVKENQSMSYNKNKPGYQIIVYEKEMDRLRRKISEAKEELSAIRKNIIEIEAQGKAHPST